MRKTFLINMDFKQIFFAGMLLFSSVAFTQITVTIGAGTQTGTSVNSATGDSGPMYRSGATSNFVYSRYHYLYTAAELTAAGIPSGNLITKLAWNKDNVSATNSPSTFQIWIKNSSLTTVGAAGQLWANLINGSTQVYNSTTHAVLAPAAWQEVTFSTPYIYTGGAVEISVNFDISTGTTPWTTQGFSWKRDPLNDRTLSYVGSTAPGTTLPNLRTVRPQVQITHISGTPCSGTPTAGTASSNPTVVCPTLPFTLSLTGSTAATGITYQWQSSPDNVVWTNISGATSTSFVTSQNVTTFYRAVVTCTNGGQSANTNSLLVTSPSLVSGTYTINSALGTGGTNFQSFNDAYNFLTCGISGPVIFNVDPVSGPYTEQLIINQIPGASATNTVTFNGNGRTIQFTSTNTNERAVIKLNGADHFRFDSLTINATSTTTTDFGFGVQLIGNADSNIVRKCVINITDGQTSTNHAGIVINNSHASATATGNTDCDNNQFEDNIITGGYYGITNVGSTTLANQRNKFLRNTIKDFYLYGIFLSGTFATIIDGNDFSRPVRSNISTGTTQAIYFTSLSTSSVVNANRIHDMMAGNVTSPNDVYGIFFTGCDALAGLENIVSNNAIYDIKSNGTIYGIYNVSSDNVYYYHNTISLDDESSTTTEPARGFFQTTAASGINFRNNLITLRRSGPGQKHGLYFGTTTSAIISNHNNVFFVPATTVNYGSWGTAAQATLANWRTASSQDANSQFINPAFTNLAIANLKPTAPGMNDLGTPVGITSDILGVTRSSTTPDIGAWEFDVAPCTTPPVPGNATSSTSVPICPNELVTLGLINYSFGSGQTYQWQSSISLAGPWTNLSPVQSFPGYSINPTTTLYYRCAVTCNGVTEFSTPVQVLVNLLFPGGTYTINSAVVTGGTNFQTFNDAYFALRCGIAGPIIFNVVPGSGPYNEQVIMNQVPGASATNTVTWNGNGEIITFLSANTNERAVFKLNGTDHFIFDSLTVVPQGAATVEFGFGFHLTNNADSNIIRNCIINLSTTTISLNFAGIVNSAGITAVTTGVNESDFNVFDNNTITGGYYGITSIGSTTNAVGNNRITRNKIRDSYSFGIYLLGNFNTTVELNDISQPVRTAVTTYNGIYLTSLNTSVKISKNRIYNAFAAAPTTTSIFYGIYLTGVDALGGLENIISNNAIYQIKGNGTQYGMYNTSSDNNLYYHNTINLDDLTASTTSLTYGWYQITAASGIDLKNNIISISRGGSGAKYCLYFATTTSAITSENNAFFRNATNTNIGFSVTAQPTLANWQTATGQDLNSITGNPFYTDPVTGNLEPRSVLYDNKGTPAGITTDIRNVTRSTTTPDVGAWEFAVPACITPPIAGTATANPNANICIGTPISLNLTGYSFGSGQTFQWQVAPTATGPFTNLGAAKFFPDTIILASGTLWYQCIVTCSGQSVTSTAVQVNMNPPFPAGTYTINNTLPTTWPAAGVGSNFNTFVEAVAVMDCGIGGPVIFNVAPGTYTEQVRMRAILGTSAVNRVTFKSANGNPASAILIFNATSATTNYVLQLDSASYITYKNMTIRATNPTIGRAIDLSNTASYDSISNCIINVPPSANTTTSVVGIFAAGFIGTNNVIKANTITGGMSGIHITGTSGTLPTRYNIIDSNTINNSYNYGIYCSNAEFNTITRNIVPVTMPRNATSYGIYLNNNDSAYQVNENKVIISGTSTTEYGIYLTGCAAQPNTGSVSRNIITATSDIAGSLYGMYQIGSIGNYTVNNVINVNTSSLTAYGLFSTGGNGIKYYNNTIQNASPASGTVNVAAYISHTTSTFGQGNIRNNIFSHTANGIAANYINTANIYSDYNFYYTAGPALIRRSTVNFATLEAWKNAENWDYNSIVYTPALTGVNLQPDITNPDVWAMHGRGVQITDNSSDINGNPRPVTLTSGVPDMGAYEFLPTITPPALPATPATPAPGITQIYMFGTDTVQKITWSPASTVPATVSVRRYSGIIPPGLAAGQASMYFYTDVTYTGTAPSNYSLVQFYIDSWMRNIPSEPTVKMGRTTSTGSWFVSSNSVVDILNNNIKENNLSYLERFTGMTDGQTPPPLVPPASQIDTSNRGRRFWVGYGHHQGFSSNGQDMVLYLSAEDSANVTVKVKGTNWVRSYSIPPNTVRVSDLIPKSGLADGRLLDEGLFDRGISIESDVPIVAYAHIYQGANSGASMLLPTGTYGYEYTSLNSDQYYASDTYSWFYAIADRDSTLVEIIPSVTTKGGRPAGVPFQVYLMRGDVYNVMGTTSGATGTDLSGSKIKSIPNASGKCYPIAVFSGSSRTALCNTSNGDNFIQQVFPNQAWGTKYLTFATANSGSNTNYNSNKWRVLVKDPATVVKRNGVIINPLTLVVPGNYYEFGVTNGTGSSGASYIESDQPVMVAQYMLSTSGTGCSGLAAPGGNGDPEMIYISPLEQGIKSARFYNTTQSAITSNYINVILPTTGLSSLRIDGSGTFTDVFAHPFLTGYSCVRHNLPAAAGQHSIISDSAFNAITYGLGSVESYGYNAGTLVKNLSAVPFFNNVFNTGNTSSYTCKGTPFRFNLQISVKPTQLVWQFSQVSNLTPNADVTQVNPVPIDSITVNNKKFYIYSVPQQYVFSAIGSYNVPITIFHPGLEGCNGSVDINLPINVIAAPTTNFTISGNTCVGSPIQFNGTSVSSNSVPVNTWSWNFGNGGTSALQNPVYSYSAPGTYNVMLRGIANDGCIGDTTKPVIISAPPVVDITQDTVYVCTNTNATFTVQNPVSGAIYNWYSDLTGGTLLGTGTTFIMNNVSTLTHVYLEGVIQGCVSGTRDRATAAILPVLPAPVVSLVSVTTNTVLFSWTSVPGAIAYQVTTNGGTTWITPSSGVLGLTHTVSGLQLGATVTLQVRASGGCLPSESQPATGQTITDQIYIPNAFTPNGDGRNDVLLVYSNVIRSLRFTVFNQWGEKIFESTNQGTGWDGTHKGKPQPSGVYIYVCDITLNTGERINRKGSLNLVR